MCAIEPVVGGGSAGCVLAARVSEDPRVNVALLEAGPPDSNVLIRTNAPVIMIAENAADLVRASS